MQPNWGTSGNGFSGRNLENIRETTWIFVFLVFRFLDSPDFLVFPLRLGSPAKEIIYIFLKRILAFGDGPFVPVPKRGLLGYRSEERKTRSISD